MAPARLRRQKILRRSRALWMSPRVWRPRLVFWLGALAIGVVSVAFAKGADEAFRAFTYLTEGAGPGGWLAALLLPPIGFGASAWAARRFFPFSQGSGIPQAIAARHLEGDEERTMLLSLRVAAGKVFLTIAGLLCGASIGREGPTIQVGAALMLAAGRIGGIGRARGLILAGSAAGIAAAFNTPLAGVVFAIEEMGRAYEARTNGLVLSAVLLAGLASLALTGQYTYFGTGYDMPARLGDWGLVLACGCLGGALGAGFSVAVLSLTRRIRRWSLGRGTAAAVLVATTCGLGVAVIGLASGGLSFGTGYEEARLSLEGGALPGWYFLAKFGATLLSMVSGIPGGIFAPSLSVGAGLGSAIGLVLGSAGGLAATLGMAGYFAGVVQAPMTAFVIILEMTGQQGNVIAVMTASLLGFGTARLLTSEPLYHALSRNYVADVLRQRRAAGEPVTPPTSTL